MSVSPPTLPETPAASSRQTQTMVCDEAKTGGMPMTTQLPALWLECPLLSTPDKR